MQVHPVSIESLGDRLSRIAADRTGGRDRDDAGTTSPDRAAAAWQVQVTSEYADVSTGAVEAPIVSVTDWDGVLRHFGLDPAEFEIVDDTVRMSRWQQSKRTESGDRDVVWLHSYKARFRRIQGRLPDEDLAQITKMVSRWRPSRPKAAKASGGAPCTFYVGWADWQLGKGEADGLAGTTARVLASFEATVARLAELRRMGRNITRISVWNMGDPVEGCEGHYAAQTATVQANQRQQLNLALSLWLTGLRALAPLTDSLEFGSVICNHGEWTRRGGKAITDDSDNVGGYLADTIRAVLEGRPGFGHLEFTIPHDEMTMLTTMSGVPVALTHGHKMPGSAKELDWIKSQSIRLLRETGTEPRLWMTAHRHHLDVRDFGSHYRIQHPALDAGSKWFSDATGMWATPGTLTMLVGEHEQAGGPLAEGGRGWSDLAVV